MSDQISKQVMMVQKIESKNFNTVSYRVGCACFDNDDNLEFRLEFDKKDGIVSLEFYTKMHYYPNREEAELEKWLNKIKDKYKRFGFMWELIYEIKWKVANFNTFIRRLKDAYKVIAQKEIEMQDDLLITDEEHIENFILALTEGMNFVYGDKYTRALIKMPRKDGDVDG